MLTPTQEFRRTDYRTPSRPLNGLDALVNGFIGSYQRRSQIRDSLERDAAAIDALAPQWIELSDHELQQRLLEFRRQFHRGGKEIEDSLFPALAAIREAADRQLGMRPFPVQLMGALALHRGYLAEMATGEGKTLTAGIAAILAGWTQRPCHIITVNDYLVQRDAERLEPLYHFCGVRVGFVAAWMGESERVKNYGCNVTYVTSKELLADFLRDRLRLGKFQNPSRRLIQRMLLPQSQAQSGLVLGGLHTAIVDEADSVLIDEAVTPLILSAPHRNDSLREASEMAAELIGAFQRETDYRSDVRHKEIELTEAGREKLVTQANHLPGLWKGPDRRLEPLYHFCGVRVGFVAAWMGEPERVKNYGCNVTYVTSKELLADFLRDRLRLGKFQNPSRRLIQRMLLPQSHAQSGLVLRGLHTAIVDEADSVLIDEAVTPLILSAPHRNDSLREASEMAAELIGAFQRETDYRINIRHKEIELTEAGREKLIAQANHLPGLWKGPDRRLELVVQALVAREFFHRDKQYIVEGDKLVIVDEFTGRPMPQRTWREGMHQAIEAKEGLPISDPTETIARLSFQRFFRCFHKLSGMTGTAREAAGEFWQVYHLPVVSIPTNRPCIREQWPDQVFADEASKWKAIQAEIERVHATNRPVLVGTRSVHASERLWRALAERGLEAKILNASRLKEEAEIIALAGEAGRIIIATNMAGRGTDIKLGHGVAKLGGLHVIATERHESGRVDRQLFGRSGRQGDPGSAQAFVSAEDELIRRYLPAVARKTLTEVLKRGVVGRERIAKAAFQLAQRNAQKLAYQQRRAVLRSDLWLDEALSFAGGEGI
jgi:preprotein translocase subunit SecA